VLLHLVRDRMTTLLVLGDPEGEVTSRKLAVSNSLAFLVVLDFGLTDRGDVEHITVRKTLQPVDITEGEEFVFKSLLQLGRPEFRADQMLRIGSHMHLLSPIGSQLVLIETRTVLHSLLMHLCLHLAGE